MNFWKRVNNNLDMAFGILVTIVLLFGVASLIWVAICTLPEFLIAILVTLISDKNKYKDEDLYEDIDYEDEDIDE